MNSAFRGKMAQEITDWENTGLINHDLAELLHQRYDPQPFSGALILKWLGLFAIFMLAMSFLGFIGTIMASFSPTFSTLCLLAVSAGIMLCGAKLAAAREQKHPLTGQALLTIALVGLYSSMAALYLINDGDRYSDAHSWFLLLTASSGFMLAYSLHLRWPLLMALLMLFHGIGSMSAYWGRGAYFLAIHDPRSMAVIAAFTAVWGLVHEHHLETAKLKRCIGFGHLYIIFGLLYLNLSLWINSIEKKDLICIVVFTVVAIAQIAIGARLKDARFTGFGIVFLSIDLYTRLYEFFWDELSKAMFFTVAGAIALALAYVFEKQLKSAVHA